MDGPFDPVGAPPNPGVGDGPADADPRSGHAVNALIHMYRAEVGRMTAYRVRLDTTTNWAITTSAIVATFAFGNPTVPHAAFLMLMLVNLFFLHLEARRFRAYEMSHYRVQFLEQFFYPEVLGEQVDPRWIAQLTRDLRSPGPRVSLLGALGWRLRRNYLWIYAVLLITWLSALDVPSGPPLDVTALAARASVGSVPGGLVCLAVGALYAYLIWLAVRAGRLHPTGGDEGPQAILQEPE